MSGAGGPTTGPDEDGSGDGDPQPAPPELPPFALAARADDPMRVCIDARMLGADGTGVARYARTLVQALEEAGVRPLLLHADLDGTSRIKRWFASTRIRERIAQTREGLRADLGRPVDRRA